MATQIEELVRSLLKRGIPVQTARSREGKLILMLSSVHPQPTSEEYLLLKENIEEVDRLIDTLNRTI